ncbi:ABC transporter permease [Anaeropeptidivorans aminofermentans]|uniref:ABC transporter permease n=1 Tax=Anaeropeptidivorans aminofermentans TaxID=2934315 RepID=UPI0020256E29|nr:ABC transporter permease [Anaeropeptidivorans aminofermentans]
MKQYIKRRVLGFFIVLVGVSILSFLLLAFSGKDPAEIMARRISINASAEMIESVRADMGLDKPLSVRYFNWIKGFFTGDMGISIFSSREISQDLAEFFPVTLSLVGMALLWIVLFSIPVSLLCARFRNGALDQITRGITVIGICIPTFWLGFLLLLAFAVKLSIFKVLPEPGIKGYILPSFALAFPVACGMIRLFRSTLLSELSSDYVQYAKARGLSARRILTRHVMRNALPPIITLFCQYLGYLIAGGAVIESVFSMKGIGTYLMGCVMASDAASVATCIVIIAAIFVSANLAGDLMNRILCPWIVRESND